MTDLTTNRHPRFIRRQQGSMPRQRGRCPGRRPGSAARAVRVAASQKGRSPRGTRRTAIATFFQENSKQTLKKNTKQKHIKNSKTHQKFKQRDITRQIQGLHIEKESWKCQWRSSTLMKRSVFNGKKHHSLVLGLFHWILWRHRLEHQIKCMLSKSPGVHHHLIAEGEWRPHLQNLLLVSTSHNSLQNVWKKSQRSSKDVMAQQKCAALHPAVWTRQL